MHSVPGGPFVGEKATTPAVQAAMEAKYGLDKPLMEQYFTYLGDIVTKFDFGPSLKQRGRQVIDIISDGMKTSLVLGLIAAAISTLFGVVLGAIAALRRNKLVDRIIMITTTAFVSMPSFIMGSLLLALFAIELQVLPANGSTSAGLVLPIITLDLYPLAYITRLTRSSMLDVLGQDYIRAKAKGVSGKRIIFGHALKNSLIPVLTYLFIAHDLLVVRHISDRIAVMYLGRMVELAPAAEIYDHPLHPYSKSLLSAVPIPDPKIARANQRIVLSGDIPNPLNAPSGCLFRTRCQYATEKCAETMPGCTAQLRNNSRYQVNSL